MVDAMRVLPTFLTAVAAAAVLGWAIGYVVALNRDPGSAAACTAEAMVCPDGSAVGRTGPNCEFTPCPTPAATSTPPGPAACTMDARICPDGSGVGRDGSRNCAFSPCPGEGRARGTAHAGPTCPVVREGDASCGDRPFVGALVLTSSSREVVVTPNVRGEWFVSLPAGRYAVSTETSMPSCSGKFSVVAGVETAVDVSCDTGIR